MAAVIRVVRGISRRLIRDVAYLINDDFGGFLLDDGGRLLL